jgi:hypothetical protein
MISLQALHLTPPSRQARKRSCTSGIDSDFLASWHPFESNLTVFYRWQRKFFENGAGDLDTLVPPQLEMEKGVLPLR